MQLQYVANSYQSPCGLAEHCLPISYNMYMGPSLLACAKSFVRILSNREDSIDSGGQDSAPPKE